MTFQGGEESLLEVIVFLDEQERALEEMRKKVREYRYLLFSSTQAQGLDDDPKALLD